MPEIGLDDFSYPRLPLEAGKLGVLSEEAFQAWHQEMQQQETTDVSPATTSGQGFPLTLNRQVILSTLNQCINRNHHHYEVGVATCRRNNVRKRHCIVSFGCTSSAPVVSSRVVSSGYLRISMQGHLCPYKSQCIILNQTIRLSWRLMRMGVGGFGGKRDG